MPNWATVRGAVRHSLPGHLGRRSPGARGFRTVLGNKDLGLAKAAADGVGLELPTMSALRQTFQDAIDLGLGDHDWASIAEAVRGSDVPRDE